MSDVVLFFRENFRVLIEAGAGPEMGSMMGSVGADKVMSYISLAYKRYRLNKDKLLAER